MMQGQDGLEVERGSPEVKRSDSWRGKSTDVNVL